jgi:protein phosphatase
MSLAGQAHVTGEMLNACFAEARVRIRRIPVPDGRPPGTTVSGVIVTQTDDLPSWMVVNIGDSRTYRMNSDGFRQVTVDHSVVQQLVAAGKIDSSEVRSLPYRNLLSRVLVGDIAHSPDVWLLPMIAGDRILVCSDGLTREVQDGTIAKVLRTNPDPHTAANQLVKVAVDAGSPDDVTALVIDAVGIREL